MTQEEVSDFIKRNLSLEVNRDEADYPNIRIDFNLKLDGEIISSDFLTISEII